MRLDKYISQYFKTNHTLNTSAKRTGDTYFKDPELLRNVLYSASRLDLIKFIVGHDLHIVNWFVNEETIENSKSYINKYHKTGLGIEFCVLNKNTADIFEIIKNKVMKNNNDSISVHELIYYVDLKTIFISFKRNINLEIQKISKIKNGNVNVIYKETREENK